MNHLKIVSKGFETYTGNFGPVTFENGVSIEPVPKMFADRIAAATQVVWIDENGETIEDASVAHRLIRDSAMRAPVLEELPRQTEEEKKAEQRTQLLKVVDADQMQIYSRNDLIALVEKDGVKALRLVGDKWKVKHKQALALIDMILERQSKWIEARNARIQAAGLAEISKENADGGSDVTVAAGGTVGAVDPVVGSSPEQAVSGGASQVDPADAGATASGPENANEGASQPQPKAE